jgi:hypothetical protein
MDEQALSLLIRSPMTGCIPRILTRRRYAGLMS